MKENRSRKILFITSEAFPYGMAGTNRIISLSKGFLSNNIDTRVLSIYKYGKSSDQILFPCKGIYEGIQYNNILNSKTKYFARLLRVIKRNFISILVYHYCLWNVKKGTTIIYYSPWILPAIAIKIITLSRKLIFIKEETEHPSIRLRGKNLLYKKIYLSYYYSLFDGLFVITATLSNYFVQILRYNKPILVVPMVVDIDNYGQTSKLINNKNFVFSGELDIQKEGLNILIGAFSIFLKEHPDYMLNLYGKPVDHSQEIALNKLITEHGIKDNIILHGFKPRDEMIQILLNADVLLFTRTPSLQASYGFSTKLGEYLASGKPVLTTSVGEMYYYLHDKVNAFIAEPDINSVALKMEEITKNYESALLVGKESRKCAVKNFNNKTEAKKILNFIQNWTKPS